MRSESLEGFVVKCPTCGKKVQWATSPHRPFCSERCKLVDLGRWLDESYRIPSGLEDESRGKADESDG